MEKYPKINYIGNKQSLVEWIIKNFPLKTGKVLDLFCGGCSVSYALKKNNYTVYSNDCLYSNYVLAKAIIENKNIIFQNEILFKKIDSSHIEEEYNKISFLSNRLYYDYEVRELAKMIFISKKLKGYEKYLFLSLIRRAMIRKIPYSRMNVPWEQIVKLRDEKYSYEKYKRKRAYHNFTFEKHILENINDYNSAIFDNKMENKAFNFDAFDMIERLEGKVDVIYIDPPYPKTMNKYGDFYGIYDRMLGKSKKYIDFSKNNLFLENFEKLVKKCIRKTEYIVISENTKTEPSVLELEKMLLKYGTVTIKKKKHQYKVTNKKNKNITEEVLLILKVEKTYN